MFCTVFPKLSSFLLLLRFYMIFRSETYQGLGKGVAFQTLSPFGVFGGPEKDRRFCLLVSGVSHTRSPRIRLASWISLGMIVTRLAWMAQRLVSSNSPTKYASDASCKAETASDLKRRSDLKS